MVGLVDDDHVGDLHHARLQRLDLEVAAISRAIDHKAEGIGELAEKIVEHRAHIEAEGTLAERRARNLRNEVLELAAARLRRRLEATIGEDPEVAALLAKVVARELDPASAATELLERGGG